MEQELNFIEDLKIDQDQLEVEWLSQASKFMQYSEQSSMADRRVRKLEEKMKVKRSQLILAVNRNPAQLGKDIKPTQQIVEAFYRTDPEYRELKKDWIDAQHQADLLKNSVFAFQQRKSALENLVELHLKGYFADPRSPDSKPGFKTEIVHKRATDLIKSASRRTT